MDLPVWSSDHPGHDVLARMYSKRLYPGDRDVLATNMLPANKHVIGPLLDRLLSDQRHIVIRVKPGGAEYSAIILEDSDESMRVKAVACTGHILRAERFIIQMGDSLLY